MSGESAPVSKSRTRKGGRLRQAEVGGVAIWRVMRQGRGGATATGRRTRRKPGGEPASETGERRAGGRIT